MHIRRRGFFNTNLLFFIPVSFTPKRTSPFDYVQNDLNYVRKPATEVKTLLFKLFTLQGDNSVIQKRYLKRKICNSSKLMN